MPLHPPYVAPPSLLHAHALPALACAHPLPGQLLAGCVCPCHLQAIRNSPTNYALQLELANLLVKLQQWNKAVERLNGCLERPQDGEIEAGSVQGLSIDVDA